MAPHSSTPAWKIPWMEEPGRLQSMGSLSRIRLSDFTFTFHFHPLEKEMATHSSVLAWRIPRMGEPSGLPSMGSHRVGHDWSDLAVAAYVYLWLIHVEVWQKTTKVYKAIILQLKNKYIFLKRHRNQSSNCQHSLDHGEGKWVPEKHLLCFIDYFKSLLLCGSQQTVRNS